MRPDNWAKANSASKEHFLSLLQESIGLTLYLELNTTKKEESKVFVETLPYHKKSELFGLNQQRANLASKMPESVSISYS